MKAAEKVFIWEDRGDPAVRFEMDSEQCMVAEILAKWFGTSFSRSLKCFM